MSQQLDQLHRAALALTPSERAELAELIWASVTAEEQAAIDSAWADEIERRIDAADTRGAPGLPADEVLDEIQADLRKRRG